MKNPFDRDTFDSGHALLDGLMRQRGLDLLRSQQRSAS